MKTIIFICHGSICRSPAAEFIAKDYLRKHNLLDQYNVFSRAVSLEEIGNDVYPPMKRILLSHNVPMDRHYAQRITREEFDKADYIFVMDENNLYYLNRLFPDARKEKVVNMPKFLNMDFSEIEDPWYTGRYELVYQEILMCIGKLFDCIK